MDDAPKEGESFHFPKATQPLFWAHSDSLHSLSPPVLEGIVYKQTRTGLVVKRGAALFRDRCSTFHDPENKTDATTWVLDRNCELIPSTPAKLVAKKRGIRPKGTWAITAAVQGVEQYIELYELTVDWPPSWAAAGYTSLVLGFDHLRQAEVWHQAISKVLADLGAAKGHSRAGSTIPAGTGDLTTTSVPVPPKSPCPVSVDAVGYPVSVDASSEATSSSQPRAGSAQSTHGRAASAAAEDPIELTTASLGALNSAAGADAPPADAPPQPASQPAVASMPPLSAGDLVWGEDVPSDTDDEDEEAEEDLTSSPDDQRWVPYRQTNGVAIYHHAADGKKAGGEFMVSCVIRGRPNRVAATLMRLRGNTTILGPVAHAEVLQPSGEGKPGVGKEIVRVILTAPGYAGYFCAPREVILERMRKDEDDGVIVILFKSVDLTNEANANGRNGAGAYGSGLYKRPVRASVAGGYTIAGLKGEGATSTESLVTCIVKADLGGVCSSGSWARPLASAAGWTDAFLDRILMSVHLLRDEVEQRRFSVQPFKLVASAKARLNEDGAVVGSAPPKTGARADSIRSSSVASSATGRRQSSLARSTARMASQRFSNSGASQAMAALASAPAIPEDQEETGTAASGGQQQPDVSSLRLDIEAIRALALMPRKYWAEVQVPGTDAPFHVRGATYLKDKKKVLAGPPAFQLGALELIELPSPGTVVAGTPVGPNGVVEHVARFVPSIRKGGAPFSIIINLVVPGSPMLSMLAVFCCDKHPSILGTPPARPMDEPHDWQPFDFVLHKFVYGSDETRNQMLKLIPHIASGSWMIKQSVGTTPAILGKALKTTYHCTPTYIEVDVDISANSVANYVTGMVRGATASLVIDLAFVLEGKAPWELPEALLGALRLNNLDCKAAMRSVDWSKELPLAAGGASKL